MTDLNEKLIIILGILVILVLISVLILNVPIRTEANIYYYHLGG